MKVLNLSSNDYASMSHQNANALRSVGVNCHDWSLNVHPFGYATQSDRVTIQEIADHFREFDVIQVFHSCSHVYDIVKSHPNVIVYHTGTRYRTGRERCDELFKGRFIVTDQCEFLLHNPSFKYLAPHTSLKPTPKASGKLIIGHYPSNEFVKGTKEIEQMLMPFINDFDIRIDTKQVSHEENLKRVAECHIYVELFKPELNGQPYGCFGVSAFEATALGCLVVTNNINRSAYENEYGHSPFIIANCETSFVNTIASLHDRSHYEIALESFHAGFYAKHGITETGIRIKQIINESIKR